MTNLRKLESFRGRLLLGKYKGKLYLLYWIVNGVVLASSIFLSCRNAEHYNIQLTDLSEDIISVYYDCDKQCGYAPETYEGLILYCIMDEMYEHSISLFAPHNFDEYFDKEFLGMALSRDGIEIKIFGDVDSMFFLMKRKPLSPTKALNNWDDDIGEYGVAISDDTIFIQGSCGTIKEVMPLIEVCKKYYSLPVKVICLTETRDGSNEDFTPVWDSVMTTRGDCNTPTKSKPLIYENIS